VGISPKPKPAKALQTLNAEERKDATCATAVTLSEERSSKNDNKKGEPKRRGDDIQQGDSGPIWAATVLQLCCNWENALFGPNWLELDAW
jgi:hypothetical protein